jgi:sodium/hydrogen exchanger 8
MSEAISTGAIVVFLMLLVYLSLGAFIEKYHLKIGHEASFTIVIGMIISFFAYDCKNEEMMNLLKFSDNTFFYFCLPPIVFASGFNMQRGNFFANIKTILLFGVLGTFVAFFSFSAMTIYAKNLGFIT